MPEKKQKLSTEEQFAYTLETHSMRKHDTWYTLNISPSIMRQHYLKDQVNTKSVRKFNSYTERQELFVNEWKAILRMWQFDNLISDFKLYLEISDDGLLHWHGKVMIKHVKEFNHMLGIHKYFHQDVRIEVKPIVDEHWDEYISKDNPTMAVILIPLNVQSKPAIASFRGFSPTGEV